MKTYIYTLTDPVTNEVRYVGKTIHLKDRFRNHLRDAKKGLKQGHVYHWIRSLTHNGHLPIMKSIEECTDNWAEREIYWIQHFKDSGANMCNHTLGGEGRLGLRTFDESVIEDIEELLKTGKYFEREVEVILGMSKGYIGGLAMRRGITFTKPSKKKTLPSRKGTKCGQGGKKRPSTKGVTYHKGSGKWNARGYIGDKRISLGYFKSEAEALNAVKEHNA